MHATTGPSPSEGVEERHDLVSGELEPAAPATALLKDGRVVEVPREQDLQGSTETPRLKSPAGC